MKRVLRLVLVAVLLALPLGCHTLSPAHELPVILPIACGSGEQNPVYIPLSPKEYGRVYETILQVVGDYGFEIVEPNRYDGRVETVPRTSPGLVLLLKRGSPDLYDRLLSTLQSYRHRVTVLVQPADSGGYFIEFIARKELEDLARPLRSTVGQAVFRSENTVERQTEVIDSTIFDSRWIYKGRDAALEQELIRRFKNAL